MNEAGISVEEWRPIPGLRAGAYEASNSGRLRSYLIPGVKWLRSEPRLLRPRTHNGYFVVMVRLADGRRANRFVHVLVAAAFIGPKATGQEVNHRDGVKSHNQVDNLEYVSCLENHRHAARTGLKARGERVGGAKLSRAIVAEIRTALATGARVTDLAKRFGVAHGTIRWIKTGRTWRGT